jgi:hypothetical protein
MGIDGGSGMRRVACAVLAVLGVATGASSQEVPAAASAPAGERVEKIVCIRHGEKPAGGLGQLTVKGLNRSLALPKVLLGKFGSPQYIFAPNPEELVDKLKGQFFYYVRPLATIEPTAIVCGLPVNTAFGFRDIDQLENELGKGTYESAVVYVAWEHGELASFARNFVRDNGGDVRQVPAWPADDYDTIYVLTITRGKEGKRFTFTIDHEGLDGVSDKYPEVSGG